VRTKQVSYGGRQDQSQEEKLDRMRVAVCQGFQERGEGKPGKGPSPHKKKKRIVEGREYKKCRFFITLSRKREKMKRKKKRSERRTAFGEHIALKELQKEKDKGDRSF